MNIENIEPLFDDGVLGVASCLLYPEVSWANLTGKDFHDVALMTGAKEAAVSEADYIFCLNSCSDFVNNIAKGTYESPELGSMIFVCVDYIGGATCRLSGAGIDGEKLVPLPVDEKFVEDFKRVNATFPLGVDFFFIDKENRVTALSRTTKLELV